LVAGSSAGSRKYHVGGFGLVDLQASFVAKAGFGIDV